MSHGWRRHIRDAAGKTARERTPRRKHVDALLFHCALHPGCPGEPAPLHPEPLYLNACFDLLFLRQETGNRHLRGRLRIHQKLIEGAGILFLGALGDEDGICAEFKFSHPARAASTDAGKSEQVEKGKH